MCVTGRRRRGRPYKVYILKKHEQPNRYSYIRLSVRQSVRLSICPFVEFLDLRDYMS